MIIKKRSGEMVVYDRDKIKKAIVKAFIGVASMCGEQDLENVVLTVEECLSPEGDMEPSVEHIQDLVETALMKHGYYEVAKSYIIYRQNRTIARLQREAVSRYFLRIPDVDICLAKMQDRYSARGCSMDLLHSKFYAFQKPGMSEDEMLSALIKAAVELTTREAPYWEMIAAGLLMIEFNRALDIQVKRYAINNLYDKIKSLVEEGLYGAYILEAYTRDDILAAEAYIDSDRNDLFTYSGLELLLKRYIIRDRAGRPLESPQEMFLGIALHLAMNEGENRIKWVGKFYDMLSTLKVTMATPTLSNARKPYHQLSSCFIDTVPDSLNGIYRSIDNFAKVSKFGGGMGLYFGKIRATGGNIRGFQGVAGGVIRWIRIANDTAVAVDQLGMRQGAVAVYLDVWHKDIPEFLGLRTNNGDDRMKAHDVFPAVCYPDMFWREARDNINGDWYTMCPHEILDIKGYALEDYYGEEWEKRYRECVADSRISKRVIPIKELVRLIIKSSVETGTPFAFNRDIVNRANPNNHQGVIYCSNLCTEIAQNTSPISGISQESVVIDGEEIVVTKNKPGDFVVCNLASLSLGRIEVADDEELEDVVTSVVRALDNVIDINYYPVPYARITNQRYRSIGLGVSGYHHMLAKRHIAWESEEHLEFTDKLFERINYYAIKASNIIAKEKGSYSLFEGSEWHSGAYFTKREYNTEAWKNLANSVRNYGIRNAYLLSIAPTSSTGIIAGTSPGIDPIMNLYFLEEKKNGLMPRVAPELSQDTYWYYKIAHNIDQSWSIRACGARQRHIDQAQSMNLYITNDYSFRQVLNLYILAYEQGVKTIYYIRSKSLEVEECESCSS